MCFPKRGRTLTSYIDGTHPRTNGDRSNRAVVVHPRSAPWEKPRQKKLGCYEITANGT